MLIDGTQRAFDFPIGTLIEIGSVDAQTGVLGVAGMAGAIRSRASVGGGATYCSNGGKPGGLGLGTTYRMMAPHAVAQHRSPSVVFARPAHYS